MLTEWLAAILNTVSRNMTDLFFDYEYPSHARDVDRADIVLALNESRLVPSAAATPLQKGLIHPHIRCVI